MSEVRKIAKNSFLLLFGRIISIVLGFAYTIYIARYLGAEGYGILSFALAFSGIFGIFTDLGLSTLTTREVARNKALAVKYLENISLIEIILAGFTFLLISLSLNIMKYPEQTVIIVYIVSASIILNSFIKLLNSIFQAFEKMEYESIGIILQSVIMIVGVIFAIKGNLTVLSFAGVYLLSSGITLGYTFFVYIWKFGVFKFEVDWNFWKNTIRDALPFGITGVFVTIFYWIDTVMLSFMKGDEIVGLYNVSYRLIMTLLIVPSIINVTIFPAMSKFSVSSNNSLNFVFRKYFKYMYIIGVPLCVGTVLLADEIIQLLYGAGYRDSSIALQILIWSTLFIFMGSPFYRLLEASNKQLITTKVTGICMLENIILNLIIIPKYSYIGASATTVVTELTSLLLGIVICSKIGYSISKNDLLDLIKVIAASLSMGFMIIHFKESNLFVLVAFSILFYFIVLYLFRGFDTEDQVLFKDLISAKTIQRYIK
ncbi:flippase [Methanosarcina hadiensis]|uniref:flippase n=1 Tax=Methanosarcina hadiensis TaxID=3078083 RepID=UPI0039772665